MRYYHCQCHEPAANDVACETLDQLLGLESVESGQHR